MSSEEKEKFSGCLMAKYFLYMVYAQSLVELVGVNMIIYTALHLLEIYQVKLDIEADSTLLP